MRLIDDSSECHFLDNRKCRRKDTYSTPVLNHGAPQCLRNFVSATASKIARAASPAALSMSKPRAMPAVARIFDGEKEAKLIALACSKPPKGRARWSLRLLENKVVELGIVDRASDSTIGRALKKTLFS